MEQLYDFCSRPKETSGKRPRQIPEECQQTKAKLETQAPAAAPRRDDLHLARKFPLTLQAAPQNFW